MMEEGQIDMIWMALNMEKGGSETQKEGSLPEAIKGKETDPQSHKGTQPRPHLAFSLVKPAMDFRPTGL